MIPMLCKLCLNKAVKSNKASILTQCFLRLWNSHCKATQIKNSTWYFHLSSKETTCYAWVLFAFVLKWQTRLVSTVKAQCESHPAESENIWPPPFNHGSLLNILVTSIYQDMAMLNTCFQLKNLEGGKTFIKNLELFFFREVTKSKQHIIILEITSNYIPITYKTKFLKQDYPTGKCSCSYTVVVGTSKCF